MLLRSLRLLLWLCLLLPGSTASSNSSTEAVTGQAQPTTPSPDMRNNHTSEPAVKSPTPTNPSPTSVAQTTTAKPPPTTPTLPVLIVQDDKSSENRSTAAPSPPPQAQEPTRRERTTPAVTEGASPSLSQRGTSEPVTPTLNSSDHLPKPTPTDDKSPLTVAAFGVISFIVVLVVVVIVLVSVVSLRFKCNRSKEEDKQKPGSSMVSESCSADTSQKDNSITLISMKNINMNNSLSYPPSEKVL
ncbi:endothelial cell-specific chemotaxis regulator isoform X2 [Pithys albifrons albifrons]|uniref:endothelial cell-specific chemotaxis regulator isoform X2 n=1 Tax=Pithys albifrons albifrons TaxID=3385563 RepID=UPI003A5D0579